MRRSRLAAARYVNKPVTTPKLPVKLCSWFSRFPNSPGLAHGCGSATLIEHTIGIVGLIFGICLILRIMLRAGP